MLRLYPSNKTENLALVIAELMKAKPLTSVFSKEVILIQSHGMGSWLQQQVSEQLGIAAMIDCIMPASFIWQLLQTLMPNDPHVPVFEKNNVRWEIFKRLPEKLDDPQYATLANYINAISSSGQTKKEDQALRSDKVLFELSEVLADLYDAYQNYRPDWIAAWEKGERPHAKQDTLNNLEAWQSDLWNSLYPDLPLDKRQHRSILLAELVDKLKFCPEEVKQQLPERIFVFGLSSLPPQWLPIMSALSAYCDVHFLIQNPCRYYWGDVYSETQQLKLEHSLVSKGVSSETAADTFLESNPLLASWGSLGRDYISIIYQNDAIKEMPVELFETNAQNTEQDSPSALSLLQDDILNLQANQHILSSSDDSVRFASCHSNLREVEALHDYLFNLLDQTDDIAPKDIIVMMPDVQDFAALIDAVFSRPAYDCYGHAHYLPYGISDQMLSLDQPMLDVLSGILNLSKLRITASEVLDWLDIEAIRERFCIEEIELEQIHAWVEGLSVRWGLSEAHRNAQLSLTDSGQGNTWLSAFKRLLAGYLFGVDEPVLQTSGEVLAQPQFTRDTQLLAGKLIRFIDVIEQSAQQQKGSFLVHEWLAKISGWWGDWFDFEYLSDDIQSLMDQALNSLAEEVKYAGFEQTLQFGVIAQCISTRFEKERVSQRFLAGRINFCTLMPMRSIPFKSVCMLGMNEGQYPRPTQKVSFDLLSLGEARIGDRSRREDDRYLYLEAICSARSSLYLSYCGHDIRDNSERFPSILVSELRDYCAKYFVLENSEIDILDRWTTEHRLQPFHPSYFSSKGNEVSRSVLQKTYSTDWLGLFNKIEIGNETSQEKVVVTEQSDLPSFDLFNVPEVQERHISLNSLARMADHPLRFYYQQTLGLTFTALQSDIEDSEPFALNHLDSYQLKSDLAHSWGEVLTQNAGQTVDMSADQSADQNASKSVYEQWHLADRFPRSPVDKIYYHDAQQSLSSMQDYMSNLSDQQSDFSLHPFELTLGNEHVEAELLASSTGCIELSVGKNIAGRFFGIWVKHVFWNLHCQGRLEQGDGHAEQGISRIVTVDALWTLPALERSVAQQYAREILDLYISLEQTPTPFLAKCSFAALFEKETQVKSAFKGVNFGSVNIQGEQDDPYWQRYCLLSEEFSEEASPLNSLPDLTSSIFYQQVFAHKDQITCEELEGSIV